MRKNEYTEAVSGITAPESSVEKMLETVHTYQNERKTVSIKTFNFKAAAAAALAVILAVGGTVGYSFFSEAQAPQSTPTTEGAAESKTEKKESQLSFTLKVNAEEITPDAPVVINEEDNNMGVFSLEERTGDLHYYFVYDITCVGDNIRTVTYTVDHDTIGIMTYKEENNVLYGTPADGAENILYMKPNCTMSDADADKHISEDIQIGNIVPQAFSSVTFDYDHQKAESLFLFEIFGTKKNNGTLENRDLYEDLLNNTEDGPYIRAEALQKLIGNTIHCTVEFENGQTSTKDVMIGAEVVPFTPDEPSFYNYSDRIVCREVTPQ